MVVKEIETVSQSTVLAVATTDDSQVVAGHDGVIRRWKIEDGRQQGPIMKASGVVISIAVSQDGRWIVSGDVGKKAILWNAATHEKVRELSEHKERIYAVDISSDCTKVATADWYSVQIFSATSGIRLLPPLGTVAITTVKFSPDGSRFATTVGNGLLQVYSTYSGDIVFNVDPRLPSTYSITPLAWSSDGQQLLFASTGQIICFDFARHSSSKWATHEYEYHPFVVSNGRFVACSGRSSVSLWDFAFHRQIGSIITHTSITSMALSPSGGCLVCGLEDGKITVHNVRDVLPPHYFNDEPCAGHVTSICPQLHASQLSLVQVNDEAPKSWIKNDPADSETLLSEEIARASSPSHYLLANRALIRVRLNHVLLAIEDAKESLHVRPSPIGYISMAVALLGQGDRESALSTFDLAFHDCEPHDNKFLLLLKSILLFESGDQEDAIARVERLATRADGDKNAAATYLYTQVLGIMYTKKGNYERAIPFIEGAKNLVPTDIQFPPLETISLVFGWSFRVIQS